MFTLLAIMEVPGIIIGIFLAKRAAMRNAFGPLMHEVFTGKSVVLLVGGIVIGAVAGSAGYQQVEPLFGGLFAGALTIFLLQLGIQAGKNFKYFKDLGLPLVGFALVMPLVGGSLGALVGASIGLSVGGSTALAVLCASASYIAAPAAVSIALPTANKSVPITASLGITFPFNLAIGLPIYFWLSQTFASML